MDFETIVHRFKLIFNFLGLVHFRAIATVPLSTWKTKCGEKLPAIIYLLVLVVLYSFSLYFRFAFTSFNQTVRTMIAYTNVSFELILQFTVIGQALVNHRKLRKLCTAYVFIQKYMRNQMGHRLEFNEFQRRIYQLIILIIVPVIGTLILRKTLITTETILAFNDILLTFYFLSAFAQVHIIVHVELLKFFLALTIQWLQARLSDFSATSLYQRSNLLKTQQLNGYTEILHLKLIHFKLWEISININQIFGWSLGAIFLRNFIEIACGGYWIYWFCSNGNYLFSTRKYL